MSAARLQKWFPWTIKPFIANAPMIGVVHPHLATEVTKAGGFGLLGCTVNLNEDSTDLTRLEAELIESRERLGDAPGTPIRIGAGFLTGHSSITKFTSTALPIIKKHNPAAVWLFAPNAKPHAGIIQALKGLDSPPKVFVQVGNVTAAREAIEDGADVIVCQGIDAGGHQFRRGMGVVTLLLEVRRLVEEEFKDREISLLAAGGIIDGKGIAAMLTLEADGVVMGTRFTVAEESIYPDFRKQLILQSVDGGTSTLKSPFNDQINNNALWGPLYDGRAIIGPVHEKFIAGTPFYDCWRHLHDDYTPEDRTKVINTWAGAGVGLVRKAQPAGEIVREVREEAKQAIQNVANRV